MPDNAEDKVLDNVHCPEQVESTKDSSIQKQPSPNGNTANSERAMYTIMSYHWMKCELIPVL